MRQYFPNAASSHIEQLRGFLPLKVVGRTSFALLIICQFALAAAAAAATPAAGDAVFSDGFDVVAPPPPPPPPPTLVSQPCVPSGLGIDYQVGPGTGQLASLDQVPWENLSAGDTVRIFYRAQPYVGKFAINALGTAAAPVRVCGVKGPNGERPIIDGANATTRPTLSFGRASASAINETRGIAMIVARGSANWGTMAPTYIQIDGLKFQRAHPAYSFTGLNGTSTAYTDFGSCIWIEQGQHITIADNEITDCAQAIFSRSSDGGDAFLTKDIRIAGNDMYGNGIVGDMHMHTTYIQSVGVTYEFNHYGPLRAGALGNSIKDRSVGAVVRYNRIEDGAYGIDLVEAQDYTTYALSDPAYHTAFVYGNQLELTANSLGVHYGGDHVGSEPQYRKGTLYFYNNTVHFTGNANGVFLFKLSTTDETAQVWNNVFAFDSGILYPAMRIKQDVDVGYTAGGILNLGVNWINTGWGDSDPWHPVPGQLNGSQNMITGSTPPIDLTTLVPLANGQAIGRAQAQLPQVVAHPVNYQISAVTALPSPRPADASMDLGAVQH